MPDYDHANGLFASAVSKLLFEIASSRPHLPTVRRHGQAYLHRPRKWAAADGAAIASRALARGEVSLLCVLLDCGMPLSLPCQSVLRAGGFTEDQILRSSRLLMFTRCWAEKVRRGASESRSQSKTP